MTLARGRVHYRRSQSAANPCGTRDFTRLTLCRLPSCFVPATMLVEASGPRGVVLRRPVCYSHAQAFLQAVARLQQLGVVDDNFLGWARAV